MPIASPPPRTQVPNERNNISFSLEKSSIDLGMCSVELKAAGLNTYPNQWNFSPEKRKCCFSHYSRSAAPGT